MRSGSLKLLKGLLIATVVSLVTPVAAAGLVVGIAGATEAVGQQTENAVFGEKTQAQAISDQAAAVQAADETAKVEPVATRDPTPLSPLVAGNVSSASAPQIAAANVQRVVPR